MIYDWLIVFFNLRCLFMNTFSPSVIVRRGVFVSCQSHPNSNKLFLALLKLFKSQQMSKIN